LTDELNKSAEDTPAFTQHELVSAYYDGIRNCIDFVQTQIIPVLNGQINLNQKEGAILGIFYRIHALGSSLTRLNNKIDFCAVAPIARTIFELLLDLKLLVRQEFTQEDIEKFRAFPEIERFRRPDKLLEFQTKNPGIEEKSCFPGEFQKKLVESPGKRDEIESKIVSLWGKTKNGKINWPDHWTGLSVRSRAELFGSIYEQKYLEIYSILSWYVHSGNASYAGLSQQSLEWIYGVSMDISRLMYIEGLLLCSYSFSLNKVIENFSPVIEFLKDAPKEILIEYEKRNAK
jgi:Family of unknown function (DUF5677)